MLRYAKHYIWFVKESYSFLGEFRWSSLTKAATHAKVMCEWEKLTPAQREAWYLLGEGRTLYM